MRIPSQPSQAEKPSPNTQLAATLRRHKTGLETRQFWQKTKKAALDLVQSSTNPFIISRISHNSRRKNAQNGGKIGLFRHKIDLFRAFSGSSRPPKIRLPIRPIPALLFPLDLCQGPAYVGA